MVPCPWFPEIAEYAKGHPEVDLGIHLTVTSERKSCRWGPVGSKDKVKSLLDQDGYFHLTWTKGTHVNVKDVECELRAQVEKALAVGMRPTHIDSHQLALYSNGQDLFELLVRLGHEYELPVLVSRNWFSRWPYLIRSVSSSDVVIDYAIDIGEDVAAEQWSAFYNSTIENLQPGITQLIVHPGYDNEELRGFSSDRESWGSAWRQRDFDFFTSPGFRELLQTCDVKLITWRELGRVAHLTGRGTHGSKVLSSGR